MSRDGYAYALPGLIVPVGGSERLHAPEPKSAVPALAAGRRGDQAFGSRMWGWLVYEGLTILDRQNP